MNYGELLLRGAERSTYRKRPIDTSKQIENIKIDKSIASLKE